MILSYTVNSTISRPLFEPTHLQIEIGDQYIKIEGPVVRITSTLTQITSRGKRIEIEEYELPASVLDAITGIDKATLSPVVDPTALDAILSQFQLELA